MSQITRCPSCATAFKVVADQLRISDGWVRCGQCKEVFDASAHLLPSPPPALLPDLSLDNLKPPPAPVARASDAGRAWGASALHDAAPPSPASGLGAAFRSARQAASQRSEPLGPLPDPVAPPSEPLPAGESQPPVMEVPTAAVPAFLTVGAADLTEIELSLEPVTPFAWRAPMPPLPPPPLPSPLPYVPPPVAENALPVSTDVQQSQSWGAKAFTASGVDPANASDGYELPFAQLRDADGPADVLHSDEPFFAPTPSETEQFSHAPETSVSPPERVICSDALPPGVAEPAAVAFEGAPLDAPVELGFPPVDLVLPERADGVVPTASASDDPAADSHLEGGGNPSFEHELIDESTDPEHEVSFVRAARREAFWRKPAVRLGLALLILLAVIVLTLQVAVQERDRIAAMDVRTRPWLVALCAPLQCEIAPQRQIADVVIDSSSFTKARGDSYQLALTMKSLAGIPLAMPAIELTLTDAQDQPVLRRVLLPTDMAAPAELPARGEWSASVAVIVTTGGARVSGYRLLAFYP